MHAAHYAVLSGCEEVVQLIMDGILQRHNSHPKIIDDVLYGTNVDHSDMFLSAARHGRSGILRMLFKRYPKLIKYPGANAIYGGPSLSWTMMHMAAFRGHLNVVKVLLEVEGDSNPRWMRSAKNKYIHMRTRCEQKATALDIAKKRGHVEMTEVIYLYPYVHLMCVTQNWRYTVPRIDDS